MNIACILLEQMILDNKDNNVSWVRIVCTQFIDLVCQLIIEPKYREDMHQIFNYVMKLESEWTVADIYSLITNGILMFRYRQGCFNRYLINIRNLAIHPSFKVHIGKKNSLVCLKQVLESRDEEIWRWFNNEVVQEEKEKSLNQVLREIKDTDVEQGEKDSIEKIVHRSNMKLEQLKELGIEHELNRIEYSKQTYYGVDMLSSCLAVTSMALYICKKYWPSNSQIVSYCLLIARRMENEGRLLEILTGEGKSCVIAMVAATYALLGRTVDIVTSSPVLSQRDAEEWRTFYKTLELDVDCNVEDNREEDSQCYKCPIVYGTVETFARDILKTEFILKDVRHGRKCDVVIVDEVDTLLIDQGVQCTYFSHDTSSLEMRHFEPILALIWMNLYMFFPANDGHKIVYYVTEPEVFFVTLLHLSNGIDPLEILRLAEKGENKIFNEGFTDVYLSKNIEDQKNMLFSIDHSRVARFFKFAVECLNLDIDIYEVTDSSCDFNWVQQTRILILVHNKGLSSVALPVDVVKDRLTKMISNVISDENETGINLPIHLRDYCNKRLRYWIDNAFHAQNMRPDREYVVRDDAVYPVDFKATGVIENNKKWGDGLQQFLEMKHDLPRSALSLITNFLSNVDFFDRYKNVGVYNNIVGVSGTLGTDAEKKFMRDTFSVEFVTIPTSRRRKLFELDGVILGNKDYWSDAVSEKIESTIAQKRAVLIICEDIATAEMLHFRISGKFGNVALYSNTNDAYLNTHDASFKKGSMNDVLKPGDVVIATNIGARGSDFVTDDIVNKNGGLFVLVTFIPLNDRVEKQAFGRTGRRGATGSCQIMVSNPAMPEWLRPCETVDEAKRLRDSIEMHRLDNMTEVNLMRNKHELFREYCRLMKEFVNSSTCDPDDLKVQVEFLNETWAKWIQNCETTDLDLNHNNLMEELRKLIEDSSNRAKRLESENIYHFLKFGAVRLLKGEYKEATPFYDRVIKMDPVWSAFAYYDRAYCTIQLMGDGYIRSAIDDLKAALCKLKTMGRNLCFLKYTPMSPQ